MEIDLKTQNIKQLVLNIEKMIIEQAKVPNRSKTRNPKTGISSSLVLISTFVASAFAYLGLDDKKGKNK